VEDLVIELRTADGKNLVSRTQSTVFGERLLPLKDAPWDTYPVAARLRVTLDGKPLGKDIEIAQSGIDGLYPDDVWQLTLE
jgi:hypothetical protein